jgi:DNA-binding transcriptional MocR family regulator
MLGRMTAWLPPKAAIERPAYLSLARHLAAAIEAGQVAPGERLPTHRDLAWRLGISVQTVSRAYEELARTGAVTGVVGRGTYVTRPGAERAPPYHRLHDGAPIVDCSILTPVVADVHRRALARTLADLATDIPHDTLASFRPRQALGRHLEASRGWLLRCGVRATAERVIATGGASPALAVALGTLTAPGELVASGAVAHHVLRDMARGFGFRLAGLPLDATGIVPDAFDRLCTAERVRAIYVMPSGLGPRSATMTLERRLAIVAIARRHDVAIVENDAWGPLERNRPPPFAALAPERTFYATGLSKCLVPALRVGWLVVPAAHAPAAQTYHAATNWMASALLAEVATRWLEDGTALNLLNWQRRALRRRNARARAALVHVPHSSHPVGLHLWLPLGPPWTEATFVAEALARGIAVAGGAAFAIGDAADPAVRICLGGAEEAALGHALATLAEMARRGPEASEPAAIPSGMTKSPTPAEPDGPARCPGLS